MTKRDPRDALSGLAPLLRVRPELQDLCYFGGEWSVSHDVEAAAQFHIVTRGACRIERRGRAPIALEAGDILLLPRGDAHEVHAAQGRGGLTSRITASHGGALRVKTTIGTEAETEIICGLLHFEAPETLALVAAMPEALVHRSAGRPEAERFAALVGGVREEVGGSRAGSLAIASNLASALFVMVLREQLEHEAPAPGLLTLLAHRTTAQATAAMLNDLARDWSLDGLAAVGGASRATLVRAFHNASSLAPLAFLTELRLATARRRLMESRDAIAQIADEVGYQSEAALSRALMRRFGVRPGALRRPGGGPSRPA